MSSYLIKSPTRVDLAGGTLDLWPLYNFVGGATTVNVAIDIWTQAEIKERADGKIQLISEDLNLNKTFSDLKECFSDQDPQLNLLKIHLQYWQPQKGFTLKTSSQSPVGGGLGGSSSLTISLLKCFSKFLNQPIQNTHNLVQLAHNLEAKVLHTPTGTQDYYPAASGGINILKYGFSGIEQKVISIQDSTLQKNFLLVNTGKAHHSGLNNFEVLKAAIEKNPKVMSALENLKKISTEMAQVCEKAHWQNVPELFRNEYKFRIQLAPAFSSPEIEKLHDLSLQNGAEAVKICGAGGGGCVLVWVPPQNRERVVAVCQKAGFKTLDAKPVDPLQL